MLDVRKLVTSAKECLGWPYQSPGSNDRNGIDCSGLLVKCFEDQGAKIAHGSNTIYRKYCSAVGKITGSSQLQPGMAVFKCKAWTDSEEDRKNRWYGTEPGNLHHIGLVVSNYPLQIVHASSVKGCVTVDLSIGKWAYWGKLKDVDYGGVNMSIPSEPELLDDPEETADSTEVYNIVTAEQGSTVNLRASRSTSSLRLEKVPVGSRVKVITDLGKWKRIVYGNVTGYMLSEFLIPEEDLDGNDPGDRDHSVTIEHLTKEEAEEIVRKYPTAYITVG